MYKLSEKQGLEHSVDPFCVNCACSFPITKTNGGCSKHPNPRAQERY